MGCRRTPPLLSIRKAGRWVRPLVAGLEDPSPPAVEDGLAALLGLGLELVDRGGEDGEAPLLELEEEEVELLAAMASLARERRAEGGLAVEPGVEAAYP